MPCQHNTSSKAKRPWSAKVHRMFSKEGWILSDHALATFPLTIFAGYAYLTETIFIFTMKCCTTHSTGTKRNPPRIVELARRLEPQGWIYDVPPSSLLNDEKQRSRTSLVSYASSGVFQLQGASKWRIRCPGFASIAGTGDPLTGYKKIEEGRVADHTVTSCFQLSLRIKDPQGAIKKLWRNTT